MANKVFINTCLFVIGIQFIFPIYINIRKILCYNNLFHFYFCLPCKIALWFPCTETGQHTPYYFTPSYKSLYLFLVICFIFKLLYSYPSLLKFFPDHLPEKLLINLFIILFILSFNFLLFC